MAFWLLVWVIIGIWVIVKVILCHKDLSFQVLHQRVVYEQSYQEQERWANVTDAFFQTANISNQIQDVVDLSLVGDNRGTDGVLLLKDAVVMDSSLSDLLVHGEVTGT